MIHRCSSTPRACSTSLLIPEHQDGIDTRPGKHTKNYGKSPCLMGKLAINGHFHVSLPEGTSWFLIFEKSSLAIG